MAPRKNYFHLLIALSATSTYADTFVALPDAYSPANPNAGDSVIWNPGQPNEVTDLTRK